MPRYNRDQNRCEALTNEGDRCPNPIFEMHDGKRLCHVHHPTMQCQVNIQKQRKEYLPEYAYDILYGDK